MAEGTKLYAVAPFMSREQLAVVFALVGAGGNLGAVIAGFASTDPSTNGCFLFKSMQAMSCFDMFWALRTPCYYWREHGGMFHGPAVKTPKEA